ncbi:MAG: hypothetical protein JWN40_3065 [Phycisphaerales bacterium]|nr:hypothetical protein [Phycisphaerales bacterium]
MNRKKTTNRPTRKRYQDMSLAELREATKEFDAEAVNPPSRPLTVDERARFKRIVRGAGRPKVGLGYQRVMVSIEKGLLGEADKAAKSQGVPRSELIALGLRLVLKTKKRKSA